MRKLKVACYSVCVALLLMVFAGLVAQPIAMAASEGSIDLSPPPPGQKSPPTEEVTLTCQYPTLSSASYAGTYFTYSVDMQYIGGEEPRVFDLQVKLPEGFNYTITPSYGEATQIAAIRLDPKKTYPDTVKITVRPYIWLMPEPGDYTIDFEASSGNLKSSIELKAIITAQYGIDLVTASGRLNTNATAGEDNYLNLSVTNTGSADLEKITFSSKITGDPPGWSIKFDPDKIDSLPVGDTRDIQVDIEPARKTIAGDYMVSISAEPESKYAFKNLDIRVTVLTPTIWGWVGVGIVVLVIAGLAVMFVRLGRR
jgi:uncharacterized membrane protein